MRIDLVWKKRVEQLCDEKNISVNKLALTAGIPQSTLQALLYGESKYPTLKTTKAICDALKITISEFYATEDFDNSDLEIE